MRSHSNIKNMRKNYRHIFFDLDRTLWDFDYNSKMTLNFIFEKLDLKSRGIKNSNLFIETYKRVNNYLWLQYRDGVLTKEKLRSRRFAETLNKLGVMDKDLSEKISSLYIHNSPKQTKLIPYTKYVLSILQKKYQLHIITNGFKEVQFIKLKNSGIYDYFQNIIISEEIGSLKPNKKIFIHAVNLCNSNPQECLMIGDDIISDVLGAKQVGIDQVFYNYNNIQGSFDANYIISDLKELLKIL